MLDSIEQFRSAILAAGITPPQTIRADGKIHRFSTNGRGDDAGWYVLHTDGIAAGAFGCWRTGVDKKWGARSEATMTSEQRAEYAQFCESARRERDAEQQKTWDEAAEEAKRLWNAAAAAPDDFPYLERKGVKAHGIRCDGKRLLVPVRQKGRGLRS